VVKATYQNEIRSIVEDRDIRFLFHFTQAANLPGIVRCGLLSRRTLAESECLGYASDQYRLDDNLDAVSVSISQVNKAMFDLKRRKSGHSDWVVLVLSPKILWKYNCLFCWYNAAKKEIKYHKGWRGGPWAFAQMFDGTDDERKGLALCYPTYPEAEVQVLGSIEPKYILGVVVDRQEMVGPVEAVLNELPEGLKPVEVESF
jgi:hypothetical protein